MSESKWVEIGEAKGAVAAFFEFAKASEDAALHGAKLCAAYTLFYRRLRSPWRKRMGRRK